LEQRKPRFYIARFPAATTAAAKTRKPPRLLDFSAAFVGTVTGGLDVVLDGARAEELPDALLETEDPDDVPGRGDVDGADDVEALLVLPPAVMVTVTV
jgi:hypothetical protein